MFREKYFMAVLLEKNEEYFKSLVTTIFKNFGESKEIISWQHSMIALVIGCN
jgi:hypothetical protein